MQDATVLLKVDGPLARITLNRPERLNAMNVAWIDDLNAAVEQLVHAAEVAVVLIRGAGRAFCAGLDLDMLETPACRQASTRARSVRSVRSSCSTP